MKILIVSWYFPPSNTMGALRVGKLAGYLLSRGHDVRVLSARDVPRPQNLRQEFPEDRVVRTRWLDVNRLPRAAAQWRRRRSKDARAGTRPASGREAGPNSDRKPQGGATNASLASRLGALYANALNLPDAYVGWIPYAAAAGRRLVRSNRPELIFASGPPFTGLVVGHILARSCRLPWVAEFRDRWADDPYYPPPPWRHGLEKMLERRLARSAAALVTVSAPWAADYRQKYGKPTETIYNGFDPNDFGAPGGGAPEPDLLRIVHTGRIYPGRRDPSPLFRAIRLMNGARRVRMAFYGAEDSQVMPLAEAHQVADLVEIHPHVPYDQSLAAQREADVLLFMQWNDPREQGNVPGKLFEYLAVRRPILGLGLEVGVPASIIRDRSAGLFSNDPGEIAAQISAWIDKKRQEGRIGPLPEAVRAGFARDEQFGRLETLLAEFRTG